MLITNLSVCLYKQCVDGSKFTTYLQLLSHDSHPRNKEKNSTCYCQLAAGYSHSRQHCSGLTFVQHQFSLVPVLQFDWSSSIPRVLIFSPKTWYFSLFCSHDLSVFFFWFFFSHYKLSISMTLHMTKNKTYFGHNLRISYSYY